MSLLYLIYRFFVQLIFLMLLPVHVACSLSTVHLTLYYLFLARVICYIHYLLCPMYTLCTISDIWHHADLFDQRPLQSERLESQSKDTQRRWGIVAGICVSMAPRSWGGSCGQPQQQLRVAGNKGIGSILYLHCVLLWTAHVCARMLT